VQFFNTSFAESTQRPRAYPVSLLPIFISLSTTLFPRIRVTSAMFQASFLFVT
jgi:hypothetical protein